MHERNEVGTAPPRGRPRLPWVERELSDSAKVVVHGSPTVCPACCSDRVMWGCDEKQMRDRSEIHPLVWHDDAWMADSFICEDCNAGWIEPDDPEPITWVRPYWQLD